MKYTVRFHSKPVHVEAADWDAAAVAATDQVSPVPDAATVTDARGKSREVPIDRVLAGRQDRKGAEGGMFDLPEGDTDLIDAALAGRPASGR